MQTKVLISTRNLQVQTHHLNLSQLQFLREQMLLLGVFPKIYLILIVRHSSWEDTFLSSAMLRLNKTMAPLLQQVPIYLRILYKTCYQDWFHVMISSDLLLNQNYITKHITTLISFDSLFNEFDNIQLNRVILSILL